ncbi:diacylglycerol/lipid kinase family protein [Lysinibacillus sp. NPDC097287]|uniref:diacylglycerol/lipid kinase family protein n=1 Tax=Lysinibacillus sp. NPDC097287 TaxID=3364144 RepID=UPI00382487DE
MQLLFIVNEHAGNGRGKKVWRRIQQNLTIDYNVAFTQYEGHGEEIVRQYTQLNDERWLVVVIGGDGTIHEIVSGVVYNDRVNIGVVAAGSGNDFARNFRVFRHAKQIEAFLHAENQGCLMDIGSIQLGAVPAEIFVNNAGVGFDAYVAKLANKSRFKFYLNKVGLGKLSYAAFVVKGLFTFPRFDVTVCFNDEELYFKHAWFVAVSNNPYFGGGMKISPVSKPNDGKIEVTIVYNISRFKLLVVFATVFFEKHTKFKEITFLQSDKFDITVHADKMVCHTDGDYIGEVKCDTNIHCTVTQKAWKNVHSQI